MDAFDADALIYAADPGNALGARVYRLVTSSDSRAAIGSVLLLPEMLTKPIRQDDQRETRDLRLLLARLELHEVSVPISDLAVELGAKYRLRMVDAVHLATAVAVGADRFITNNRHDFTKDIAEVDVTYPDDL